MEPATNINHFIINEKKSAVISYLVAATIILLIAFLVLLLGMNMPIIALFAVFSIYILVIFLWYFVLCARWRKVEIDKDRIIYTNIFGRTRETHFNLIDKIVVSWDRSYATIYVDNERFVKLDTGLCGMNFFLERCVKENIKMAK